jgi:hypothetical protein
VFRYRDLVDEPARTLDRISRFLGIAEGVVSEVPPSKVSYWVESTPYNRMVQRTIRLGAAAGAHLPAGIWQTASRPLLGALQRDNKPRPALQLDQRMALVEHFRADLALLGDITGDSYDDWLGPVGRGAYSNRRS